MRAISVFKALPKQYIVHFVRGAKEGAHARINIFKLKPLDISNHLHAVKFF